jgi:phosphoribosylaminoimidazolecarboxamide formyltransferase/IMP cyclohydrolase
MIGSFIILQADENYISPVIEFREMFGVVFSQQRNDTLFTLKHLEKVVTEGCFTPEAQRDLIVASISVKYTQSNSVGYAKNGQMIGIVDDVDFLVGF